MSRQPDTATRYAGEMLQLAMRSPRGNPWHLVGARQCVGGAKMRMFERMKRRGWFDDFNVITEAGRSALPSEQDR